LSSRKSQPIPTNIINKLTDDFALKQEFSFGSKAYRALLGYTFKTDGFIDYATSLNKSTNTLIGFKYHFNHN